MVLTTSSPNKNSNRKFFVDEIKNQLNKIIPIEIVWIICQPIRLSDKEKFHEKVFDISEFNNGLDLIEKLNPDIILVNSSKEILQYSVSLAASIHKIPLIGFSVSKFVNQPNLQFMKSNFINQFVSNKVPTDDESQKKFLRRGKFMFYKLLFSLKTQYAIKFSWFKILKNMKNDFMMYFFNKPLPKNKLINLHLLQQSSQIELYENAGIPKNKLIVIGSILMDRVYEKLSKYDDDSTKISQKNILILTDSLFEHGIWTQNQRNIFLKKLFSSLNNIPDLKFSIKIHPTNENVNFYKNLLDELKIKSKVFQSEDLWQLIKNFNLIISYGYSTAHTEIACSTKKMILLNDGANLPRFPLVNEALSIGSIKFCNDMEELPKLIENFLNKEIIISEKFKNKRNELFYKFDGKSAERGSNAICSLLKDLNDF